MSSDDRPADDSDTALGAGGAPTGAVPTGAVPTGAVPTADVPSVDVPAADVPVREVPAGDATADDVLAGDLPAAAPAAAADTATVPDAATLEQIATPARRRRAPRISAFITTGVLVGMVLGWLLALLGTGTTGEGRTGAILLTTAGLGALGAIVGAGLAALADRRSAPRVARRAGRRSIARRGTGR